VHGRALGAHLDPAPCGPPARVELDADADRRRPGAEDRLDLVEVLARVDGDDRRLLGVRRGTQRQLFERAAVVSCSARQRIDLLATRIGFSPARPSISSALDQSASRSTKANGASTSAKVASRRSCD
jgi:hypothetical protein